MRLSPVCFQTALPPLTLSFHLSGSARAAPFLLHTEPLLLGCSIFPVLFAWLLPAGLLLPNPAGLLLSCLAGC